MAAFQPVDAGDLRATARWIEATLRNVDKLHFCQRHEQARNLFEQLKRTCRIICEQQSTHGYFAEIWFEDLLSVVDLRDSQNIQIPFDDAIKAIRLVASFRNTDNATKLQIVSK